MVLRPRHWVNKYTLEVEAGASALRRLRELRDEGYEIKMRKAADGISYDYRLVGRK